MNNVFISTRGGGREWMREIAIVSWFFAVSASVGMSADVPQRYQLSARASTIDPLAREQPEISFLFEKDGKPQDVEYASVDMRVPSKGKLVIWLMGHSPSLFERVNSYGLHAISVHYANGWFGLFGKEPPPNDEYALGKIRLEAATGEDVSDLVNIPKPNCMMERSRQFLIWLAHENPEGKWDQFLREGGSEIEWDRVVMAGSSHGSTTAARFAKHQKVDRVVMLCGPRDQYERWQAIPSATEPNRFFGFSHTLDGGWTADHYCRSWKLLGLAEYGPIVNADQTQSPFENTRRIVTSADVKGDVNRAHSSVVPGGAAVKDVQGKFVHEDVWRYLFTHPVDRVGRKSDDHDDCLIDQRKAIVEKKQ